MYECEICYKCFNRKENLNRHLNSKISCRDRYKDELKPFYDNDNNIPSHKMNEFYNFLNKLKCIYCNKEFTSKNHLLFHINNNCKIYKEKLQKKDELNEFNKVEENKENKENKENNKKEENIEQLLLKLEKKIEEKTEIKSKDDKMQYIIDNLFNLLKTQEKSNNSVNINGDNNTNNSNINSNNNSNSNLLFNFQYIEKNFNDAKNLEDTIKIENVSDDMVKICENKYINDAAKYILKKLCVEDCKLEERPIHCLDSSRRKYAVKTENKWKKDCGGNITRSICQPVILHAYKKVIDKIRDSKKYPEQTMMNLFAEHLDYKNSESFNKTLDDLASDFSPKNCIKPKQKMENNTIENNTIENDIYSQFLKTKTRESISHVHTKDIYKHFVKWYEKKISTENIPSSVIFLKNIKKIRLHHKSIKIGDKVSSGFKNLELC
jgi:hypothetical protein